MTANSENYIKITNPENIYANLYRFNNRRKVDKLFKRKNIMESEAIKASNKKYPDEKEIKKYNSLARKFDKEARKFWRKIIKKSNEM